MHFTEVLAGLVHIRAYGLEERRLANPWDLFK